MSRRALTLLLAVVAALAVIAGILSVSERREAEAETLLLPTLKPALNDLQRITALGAGAATVATLERSTDGWSVTQRAGYPADLGQLRGLLLGLADARILEEKTSNPDSYGKLGVQDVEAEDAGGVRLDLEAAGQTFSVILGDSGVGGGEMTYARRPGEAKSWLVSGELDPPREAAEWLDRAVTDIPSERVAAVTLTHPDGTVLRLTKTSRGATDFDVESVPEGRALSYPTVANGIGSVLAALTLDDVRPAADFEPGDQQPVTGRFETFDGLVVESRAWVIDEETLVALAATADRAVAERHTADDAITAADADDPEAASAAAEAPAADAASFEQVETEAAGLQQRFDGWIYALPGFKAEQFSRSLEDLLAPAEQNTD